MVTKKEDAKKCPYSICHIPDFVLIYTHCAFFVRNLCFVNLGGTISG